MNHFAPTDRPHLPHRMASGPHALDEPLYAVRPSFHQARQVRSHVVLGIFFGFWGAVFVGGLLAVTLRALGFEGSAVGPMATGGLFGLTVLPVLGYRRLRRTYEDTILSLYPDGLEFHGAGRHKVLPREQVSSVRLESRNRRHDLGTLVVASGSPESPGPPLFVPDVLGPDEARSRVEGWLAGDTTPERDLRAA